MDVAKHEDEAVDSSTKASEFENNNSWFGIKMPESIFWSIPQLILFALVVGLEFVLILYMSMPISVLQMLMVK